MATKTSKSRPSPGAAKEFARLRAEVARLRAQVQSLKGQLLGQEGRFPDRSGKDQAPQAETLPLPAPDANGNYPASETIQILLARQIVRRRQAAGWTQAELAQRAGVRQETVSRLESGKNAPNVTTVDKLERALQDAGV